jgi:hypothetical protein
MKLRFLLLAAGLSTFTGASHSGAADSSSLSPPTEARLLLRAVAEGVQIYTCVVQGSGAVWTLKAPEAVLRDAAGEQVIGKHFGGPSWQANDGNTVVGEVVARADAPSGDAIPWLLLRARSLPGSAASTNWPQRAASRAVHWKSISGASPAARRAKRGARCAWTSPGESCCGHSRLPASRT